MVNGARAAEEEDAILGVAPRWVAEPSTVDEAAEILRGCAGDRLAVAFAGGGTDLELGPPPSRLDVLLRTRALHRVVEHLPSDQIATVEAGVTVATLQEELARHGQRLALDPPHPGRATLGGVVAANAFGSRRHRYGAARDLVVGMTFVRADGVVAKGGGKVVKNVAGFDVPRLLVGSLGTLAFVATVTVRLHPLPEVEETVCIDGLDAPGLRQAALALRAAQLEPTSVAALIEDGAFRLGLRFEGFGPGVAEGREGALELAHGLGRPASALPPAPASRFWEEHDRARTDGAVRLRISAPPAALPAVAEAMRPVVDRLAGARAVLYPTLGFAFLGGGLADADAQAVGAEVGALRVVLTAIGGSAVLLAGPFTLRAVCDPWGLAPASLALMRRVKDALDPEHRLAPGRFVGGL